jgi:hypothetical protein
MSRENPYVCPRCGTLINEVPAQCRVCGTQLKPAARPPKLPTPGNTSSSFWYWIIGLLLLGLIKLVMVIFSAGGLPGHG